ncbi:MAG: LptF/LptG family permease [Bacteroidota bacterium]
MKILDRYILRQFLTTFAFILGMFVVICLLVDLVEKIDDFIDKDPPIGEIIFDYYLNFIPYYGLLLMPVCVFLAVIFFTSRMAGRTELIPLLSVGVSFYRLLAPYILTAILLAGVSFYFKAYQLPSATNTRIEFEYKYFKKRRISSTKHIHKKVAPDTYVYISYYNERRKEGHTFALERFDEKEVITKIAARKIIWVDSTEKWRLENVDIRHLPDKINETIEKHKFVDTTFLLTPDDIFIKEQWAETMSLPALADYITLEEMRGSDILKELYVERHRRYSDPVALIILTLIGYAMSSRKSRGGVALRIGLGLITAFSYIAVLFIGTAIAGDRLEPWIAVWAPNAIYLGIAMLLLWRAPK